MSDTPKPAFKGVWIPKAIWESREISWMEKCLLAEIDSLDDEESGDRGCFASNKYFAQKFGSTEASIANQISHLRKLGFVKTIGFDGRERNLRLTSRLSQDQSGSELRVNPQVKAPIRENTAEKKAENTPSPSGAPAAPPLGKRESSIQSKIAKLPTTEAAIRIAKIFGRKPTTGWQDKEVKAFKKIQPICLEELSVIESYYAAEQAKGKRGIHRRDIGTFLNNFLGEADRARAWAQQNGNGHITESEVPQSAF